MENEGMGCCLVGTIILGFFYWPLWLLSIVGVLILIAAQSDSSKK